MIDKMNVKKLFTELGKESWFTPDEINNIAFEYFKNIPPSEYPNILKSIPIYYDHSVLLAIFNVIFQNENFVKNSIRTNSDFSYQLVTDEWDIKEDDFIMCADGTLPAYEINIYHLILEFCDSSGLIVEIFSLSVVKLNLMMFYALFNNKHLSINEKIELLPIFKNYVFKEQEVSSLIDYLSYIRFRSKDLCKAPNRIKMLSTVIHLFDLRFDLRFNSEKLFESILFLFSYYDYLPPTKDEEPEYITVENEIIYLLDRIDKVGMLDELINSKSGIYTLLHYACKYNLPIVINYLITNGAKMITGEYEYTPFDYALKYCSIETVERIYKCYQTECQHEITIFEINKARENLDRRVYLWAKNKLTEERDPIFILHREYSKRYDEMMSQVDKIFFDILI